jgi:hypothetical protein
VSAYTRTAGFISDPNALASPTLRKERSRVEHPVGAAWSSLLQAADLVTAEKSSSPWPSAMARWKTAIAALAV